MSSGGRKFLHNYIKNNKGGQKQSKESNGHLNIDKRKAFGTYASGRAETQDGSIPVYSEGGHIERSSYKVKKTRKPKPAPDMTFKKITQEYFKNKEIERLAYLKEKAEQERKLKDKLEAEEAKKRHLEEELRIKHQQQQEKEERDKQINWDFDQKIYHIMRDVNNETLRQKGQELYLDKGSYKQFQYSSGDPKALEEEKKMYRLSKTQHIDLTDKFSGEQNRMVYDQVRPSYFGDKREEPTFDSPVKRIVNAVGDDITIRSKSNTLHLVSQNSQDYSPSKIDKFKTLPWESSLRDEPSSSFSLKLLASKTIERSKENQEKKRESEGESKYAAELYSFIEPVKFRNLRTTYEQYATRGDLVNYKTMDSGQFQSLLRDNKLYFKGFAQKDADLLFYKGNTKRFITFDEFCRIIIDLAERKYKNDGTMKKSEKVKNYLKEFVFIREKDAYKHKTNSYEDWLLELETEKLSQLLKAWKPTFKDDFHSYASTSLSNSTPSMDSKTMYRYCNDKQIIPNLLNRNICFKLFKECQRAEKADIHKEHLTFSEFMEFVSFIGIHYFTQNQLHYPKLKTIEQKVDAMFKWLQNKLSE